jgi:hypothetical protein
MYGRDPEELRKYFTGATPGPMPPTPEQLDAAIEWLDGKLDDGTFDCV